MSNRRAQSWSVGEITSRLSKAVDVLVERARPSRLPPQPSAADDLRVQLTMPAWTIHRSTDRSYLYERLALLAQRYPLRFAAADSPAYIALWNARYLVGRAAGVMGVALEEGLLTPPIDIPDHTEVVFSYGEYPDSQTQAPVVWEHTFAPQLTSDQYEWEAEWRRRAASIAERAARVVTATDVSAEWFVRLFPAQARKVHCVPYYFPDLAPIDDAALHAKTPERGPVRLLFVGKQAKRKGLESFVAAFRELDVATQAQLEVHVISAMLDGPIALPPSWRWQRSVPDVQAAMRDAHAFVFPALGEAFGLVLVEAMAAGCMPITTKAPIQRSIVGPDAGAFIDPRDPHELAQQLRLLTQDRARLAHGMRAARERFIAQYHAPRVGQRYADLLWDAAGRAGPAPLREPR